VGWEGAMNWTDLVQDRNRWRALLNAVMNLRIPYNGGNFFHFTGEIQPAAIHRTATVFLYTVSTAPKGG